MKKVYEDEILLIRQPCKQDKNSMIKYKQEFLESGEKLYGSGGFTKVASFEEWLDKIKKDSSAKTVDKDKVPATQFVSIRKKDNKLIGVVNVRHHLNEFLLMHGGHIGDSILPSERNKGYATRQIKLACQFLKDKGENRVLITCLKNNPASAKSIIKAGGVFENEIEVDDGILQRYWIEL